MKRNIFLLLAIVTALFLSACSGVGAGENPSLDLAPTRPAAETATLSQPGGDRADAPEAPTQTSIPEQTLAEPVDAATPTAGAGDGGQAPDASRPTPRPGMEATNPGEVRLASGKVQLIEFFAFW